LYEDFDEVVGTASAEGMLEAALAGPKKGPSAGSTETGSDKLSIDLLPEAAALIANVAFNNANKRFKLFIYRVSESAAQLAIAPAPTHGDVTVSARFPTREEVEFVLEVPTETKVDATLTRDEMRSGSPTPLSEGSLGFTGCV